MTATVTKSKVKQKVVDEIVDLDGESQRFFGLADEVLESIVLDERKPFFAELTFFKGRCGWDDAIIERQISRTRSRLRHQGIAGTSEARAEAIAEKNRSQKILETEGPKIDEQIAALTAQKNMLETNANRAVKRCEDIDNSLSELRKLLPPHMEHEYNRSLQSIAYEFAEIGELGVEIRHREVLLGAVPTEHNAYRLFCETVSRCYPNCVRRYQHSLQLFEPFWAEQKEILAGELASMKAKHADLCEARAKAMLQLDEFLNFYAR